MREVGVCMVLMYKYEYTQSTHPTPWSPTTQYITTSITLLCYLLLYYLLLIPHILYPLDYYILESKGYPNKPRVADDTVMLDTLDVEYLSTVCKVTGMSVALEYWHRCVWGGVGGWGGIRVVSHDHDHKFSHPLMHTCTHMHTSHTSSHTYTSPHKYPSPHRLTDELLSKLHDINKDAEKTGTFDRLYGRRQLVEMVALVNIINTNMLYRMRVLDKHRYAWRDEDVDTLWGRLAVELDMVPRCDSLTSKVCGSRWE